MKTFADHEKSIFWNYDKNNGLLPSDFSKKSTKKIWFLCSVCKHDFETQINTVVKGNWCPYCSGLKLCYMDCNQCFIKSFATHEKSKYWSANNPVSARMVSKFSSKKYLFDCECGHEFSSNLANISNGGWCPYCSIPAKKLCNNNDCKTCFAKSFASHEKSKYWSDKNTLTSRQVLLGSAKKYIFNCDCGHEFENIPKILKKGIWCLYCSNPPQLLCKDMDCKSCMEKSFASHEKATYWSDKNELKPRNVFKMTNKKYIFLCDCGHEFAATPNHVASGGWCSYCSAPPKKLCDDVNCSMCFNNSFASNKKAKYWSESKNEINPRMVFRSTGKQYWFDHKCDHSIFIRLNDISSKQQFCAYCKNQKLCEKADCDSCFNKSFASHEKIKYWSPNNTKLPRDVFKGTKSKYKFICEEGHEFESVLCGLKRGNWCPFCYNKGEQKLFDFLKTILDIERQFKADWCMDITYLPFDFVVKQYNIIIELDGRQHFEQVSTWKSPEETQKMDKYKMRCANDNGFAVIRILWDDVYYDKNNWNERILSSIEKIKNNNIIQNIFICEGNEYEDHIIDIPNKNRLIS